MQSTKNKDEDRTILPEDIVIYIIFKKKNSFAIDYIRLNDNNIFFKNNKIHTKITQKNKLQIMKFLNIMKLFIYNNLYPNLLTGKYSTYSKLNNNIINIGGS